MQKNALVLSGGGSRGAYELGVWQALIELDIDIHIVTGTSVGALNAAMIVQGDFEKTRSLWMNMKTDMVFRVDIDDSLSAKQKETQMLRAFLFDYAKQGGMDAYPLKLLLDEYLDENAVRESPVECGIICVDKKTLKPKELYKEDIEQGMLNEYLVASSSLYPAIQSHTIGDDEYIDGGYYDNLPVELAIKKNPDLVITVDLNAIGMVRKKTMALAKKLVQIRSYWDLGPLLVFDFDQIARNIRLGYLDGMRAFHAFDGIAYAFIRGEIPAFIKKNKENIAVLNRILGFDFHVQESTKKEELFFLRIKRFLDRKYSQEYDCKFSSFLKACMESAAEIFGLSPEKIYSVECFNRRLTEKVNETEVSWEEPAKSIPLKKIKESAALFTKTARTIYFASMIKNAVIQEKVINLLSLSLLFPDELLGAYYLTLIS